MLKPMPVPRMFWICVGVLLAAPAFTDGIYIPPKVVASLPAMPEQRGLIIWRDGVEELLVESDFDGEGERMAWILPVPSEPTNLQIGASGVFATLEHALPNKIVDSSSWLSLLLIVLIGWCGCQWAVNRFAPLTTLRYAMGFYLICVVMFVIYAPMMSRAGGNAALKSSGAASESIDGGNAGIIVLDVRRVGGYEVSTLRADTAAALAEWLETNGFQSLPDGGEAIVTEYIEEGWCFITAKLQREGDGYARPHPLSITFAAERPVYPMRLTQLANTDLRLDLYIIAGKRAQAPGMDTIYCDRFSRHAGTGFTRVQGSLFEFQQAIGLPWLTDRMQAGDVLTHLRAEVPVAAMYRDTWIGFRGYEAYQQPIYLPGALRTATIEYGLTAFFVTLTVGGFIYYFRTRRKQRRREGVLLVALAVAIALPIGAIPGRTFQRGEVDTNHPTSMDLMKDSTDILRALRSYPDVARQMDRAALETYVLDNLHPTQGGAAMLIGEGPGQFQVIEDSRGIVLRFYAPGDPYYRSDIGAPMDTVLRTPKGEIPFDD